jgi:hypothetical protein
VKIVSPEEIRGVKANLLLEFQEAEDQVHALKEKVAQIGDIYESLGRMLKQSPLSLVIGDQIYTGALRGGPINQPMIPPNSTPEEIARLVLELSAATKKLEDLTQRKENFKLR